MSTKTSNKPEVIRCTWLNEDAQYIKYHDEEWGQPTYDSMRLFEMICLEGQQAGLSWITILKKRERYREVFHNFNPDKISKVNFDVNDLMNDSGIIRHKGKILAILDNAKAFITMEESGECFSKFIWNFVNNDPIVNRWTKISDVPTQTEQSVSMSKQLKKRNFKFVGPTTCYAFMQACGLVNDHLVDCWCHPCNITC